MTERTVSTLNPSPAAPSSPDVTPEAKKAYSPPAMTVLKISKTALGPFGAGDGGEEQKSGS